MKTNAKKLLQIKAEQRYLFNLDAYEFSLVTSALDFWLEETPKDQIDDQETKDVAILRDKIWAEVKR